MGSDATSGADSGPVSGAVLVAASVQEFRRSRSYLFRSRSTVARRTRRRSRTDKSWRQIQAAE